MRILSVEISGMHGVENRRCEFDNITYLCGPNGSGKSTILDSIHLCLLGYLPQTHKTKQAIFKHATEDIMKISVEVEYEASLYTITRIFSKNGNSVDETFRVSPENEELETILQQEIIPSLNFGEFLALTPNKQKDFLISCLPSVTEPIDVNQLLTDLVDHTDGVETIIEECSKKCPRLTSVEDVKALNEFLKSLQSNLQAQEKRLIATSQSLIYYDDYVGTSSVEDLSNQITELTFLRDKSLKYEMELSQLESKKEALKQYENLESTLADDVEYLNMSAKLEELKEKIQQLDRTKQEYRDYIVEYKSKHSQNCNIVNSNGICPYTDEKCVDLQGKIDKLTAENTDLVDKISQYTRKLEKLEIQSNETLVELSDIDKKRSELEEAYQRRDNLLQSIEGIEEDAEYESSDALADKLQLLNQDLIKASANEKYNEMMETVQKEKLLLTNQLEFVKLAVKKTGANGLQTQIAAKPFENMETFANDVLSKLELVDVLGEFKFTIEEKANSFSYGVIRDKFIPFEMLSSGEKCLFTLVFLTSFINQSNTTIKLILIDDLFDHLDVNNFELITNNLYKLSDIVQIIVAGVNEISNEVSIELIDVGETCC